MPTVRANGLDIAYDVRGAGPPLVLLHGATSVGREDFAAQLPLMSKAFLVHLPDARATAGRAGTPPRASATTGSSTTSRGSSTRSGSTRSTSSGSRWAR